MENAIFSWQETALCFWATGVLVFFLPGNRMTTVALKKRLKRRRSLKEYSVVFLVEGKNSIY